MSREIDISAIAARAERVINEYLAGTDGIFIDCCLGNGSVLRGTIAAACRDAALRAELAEAKAERARYGDIVTAKLGTLEAENARLREALKDIARNSCCGTEGCTDEDLWCEPRIARAALAGGEKTDG